MRRIERIMKALDNPNEPDEKVPGGTRKEMPEQNDLLRNITSPIDSTVPTVSDNDEAVAEVLLQTNVMSECGSNVESPAAHLPLTPLLTKRKAFNNKNSLDSLNIDKKISQIVPIEPAYIMKENRIDVDSPAAPPYSPLTPLLVKSNLPCGFNQDISDLRICVADSVQPENNGNNVESLSTSYLPQSPVITASRISERRISSPLPPMTPETFKLFETLNQTFPTAKDLSPTVENNENFVDNETDFSNDTDSDYIPDSEENSDIEEHSHVVLESVENSDDNVAGSSLSLPTSQRVETHSEETEDLFINAVQQGCPKRGRKRKYADHTLAERKKLKYSNLPYHGKSKQVPSRVFNNYECKCLKQCHSLISKEKRKQEFDKYTTSGSYEAQLLFILNYVKELPKTRSYIMIKNNKTGKNKTRSYRRHYYIGETEVCKDMFLNNFQISSKKVDISLKKNRSGSSIKDQRGKKQGGWNKTSEEDIKFIINIINALPKYESHYGRAKNSDCKYLKLGMTVQKIYEIYRDELKKTSKKPVSLTTLKRIFYTHFNLRCKTLKKDTCNRCDTYQNKLKNCTSEEEKVKLETEKEEHVKRAQELRDEMNKDLERAKTDKHFECLTFDLEKTLPLPRIPTNIVFYKRQLWAYNSGIHAGSNDTGHCNVWVEGEAGRGAQEVGSCLVHFIKTNLDIDVQHLVLWSDCCGGQNRNIKIVIMLKALLNNHPHLQTITFKYLESGHTFLPNDTHFSKIEYQLKFYERIYTVNEYINVMKVCKKKNPLQVHRMQKKDFINRKTFITKEKVNWLKTKEILLRKDNKYSIFMKGDDRIFRELSLEKKVKKKTLEILEDDFEMLWPNGKEIAQAKLDDLKSMFDLIPKDCIDFYKSLKGNESIIEDVDGIGVPDFDILEEPEYNDFEADS